MLWKGVGCPSCCVWPVKRPDKPTDPAACQPVRCYDRGVNADLVDSPVGETQRMEPISANAVDSCRNHQSSLAQWTDFDFCVVASLLIGQ